MSAPAIIPAANSGAVEAPAPAARGARAAESVVALSLFPLVLDDLLQGEAANPPSDKKQEVPDANLVAVAPVAVNLPVPPPPAMSDLAPQATAVPDGADHSEQPALNPTPAAQPVAPGAPVAVAEARLSNTSAGPLEDAKRIESLAVPLGQPAPTLTDAPDLQALPELSEPPLVGSVQREAPQGHGVTQAPPAPNVSAETWISRTLGESAAPAQATSRAAEAAYERVSAADRSELAFSARLSPMEDIAGSHPDSPAAPVSAFAEESSPSSQPADSRADGGRASPAPMPGAAFVSADSIRAGVEKDRPARGPGSGFPDTPTHAVEVPAAAEHAGHTTPASGPQRPAAVPLEPAQPASGSVRAIRLQVAGGEQRVEVRLSEHRGEVQVAVRTPDARLTEALRSDLPALSARLEQSGFRAETWHPGAMRLEPAGFPPERASSGSAPHGQAGERHGNPQQHEQPPRRAPVSENLADSRPQEFSRLLAALG